MATRPKEFVAATDFTYARQSYTKGDPVTHGPTLDTLLQYGDKFVVDKRHADTADEPINTEES